MSHCRFSEAVKLVTSVCSFIRNLT